MVSGEAYAGGGGVLPPPPFAGGAAAAAAPTLPHACAAEAAAALLPLPLLFVGGAGGEVLVVDATPVVVIPAGAAGGSGEPQALPPGGTVWPPFRPLDGATDDGVDSGVRSVPIWFGLTWVDVLLLFCSALGRSFLLACHGRPEKMAELRSGTDGQTKNCGNRESETAKRCCRRHYFGNLVSHYST